MSSQLLRWCRKQSVHISGFWTHLFCATWRIWEIGLEAILVFKHFRAVHGTERLQQVRQHSCVQHSVTSCVLMKHDHALHFFSSWQIEADSENLIKVKAAFRKISACDSCPVLFSFTPITKYHFSVRHWVRSDPLPLESTPSDSHTCFPANGGRQHHTFTPLAKLFLHLGKLSSVTARFLRVIWGMIDLTGCSEAEGDWCLRRPRLSVLQDHDGPCPSLCGWVQFYVLTYLSLPLVGSLCWQACVSAAWLWLEPVRDGDSDWCNVSLCEKCLARSCCVWARTDGPSLPLIINQTWHDPE